MKKPVAKTIWAVASAVVIVLAALVIPAVTWRQLPALSTAKNTGVKVAVPAGIMQADIGLNRILHNTQWIVGPHVHVAVLVGLTMTLYSAVYILFPIVTNGVKLYSQKLANVHFWCHLLGGIGMGAFMGMAGLNGMLRRTIYYNGEFNWYMILAALSGALMFIAFLAFFYNIVMSLGLNGVIQIFFPSKLRVEDTVPATNE